MRFASFALAVAFAFRTVAASATEEAAEFWINPSFAFDVAEKTGVEVETGQRFRSRSDGRVDSYFARLVLVQDIAEGFAVGGGLERRINAGGRDETRLMQQLSTSHGIWRTRLRVEQRFVDHAGRMGLRLRSRLGASVPVDTGGDWQLEGNVELFFTLRSAGRGGADGLTAMRTQIGIGHNLNPRVRVSLAYARQQDFSKGRPDPVGHAPVIGLKYEF